MRPVASALLEHRAREAVDLHDEEPPVRGRRGGATAQPADQAIDGALCGESQLVEGHRALRRERREIAPTRTRSASGVAIPPLLARRAPGRLTLPPCSIMSCVRCWPLETPPASGASAPCTKPVRSAGSVAIDADAPLGPPAARIPRLNPIPAPVAAPARSRSPAPVTLPGHSHASSAASALRRQLLPAAPPSVPAYFSDEVLRQRHDVLPPFHVAAAEFTASTGTR